MNTLFGITGLRRWQELVLKIYRVWNKGDLIELQLFLDNAHDLNKLYEITIVSSEIFFE
jgi:hypothetical protein